LQSQKSVRACVLRQIFFLPLPFSHSLAADAGESGAKAGPLSDSPPFFFFFSPPPPSLFTRWRASSIEIGQKRIRPPLRDLPPPFFSSFLRAAVPRSKNSASSRRHEQWGFCRSRSFPFSFFFFFRALFTLKLRSAKNNVMSCCCHPFFCDRFPFPLLSLTFFRRKEKRRLSTAFFSFFFFLPLTFARREIDTSAFALSLFFFFLFFRQKPIVAKDFAGHPARVSQTSFFLLFPGLSKRQKRGSSAASLPPRDPFPLLLFLSSPSTATM